jgi:hypothetical protein
MKLFRMFAGLLIILLIACAVALLLGMRQDRLVYATPDTESAFLRSYNPKPAVTPYKIEANEGWLEGETAGAGEGYAHHQRDFHGEIAIASNDATLANALNEDVREQLLHSGAKILGETASPEHGFRYSYRSGNSLGEVIIAPPHISNSQFGIANEALRVAIDIYLDEKWFPPKKDDPSGSH